MLLQDNKTTRNSCMTNGTEMLQNYTYMLQVNAATILLNYLYLIQVNSAITKLLVTAT